MGHDEKHEKRRGSSPSEKSSEKRRKKGHHSKTQLSTRSSHTHTKRGDKRRKSSSSSSKSEKPKKNKVEFNHEERKRHRLMTADERPKLEKGDIIAGMIMKFEVLSLLGSGGFGDVYKVKPHNNPSANFEAAAMKIELLVEDNHPMMNRLKLELAILKLFEALPPGKKSHFAEMYDRGRTSAFKFIVMELVGKSVYSIQKEALKREFSVTTALKLGLQTLEAVEHLHEIGYLHRDIKPHNYSIGLGNKKNKIYILDFGIARRFVKKSGTKILRVPRQSVKFLGTLKYASRSCHYSKEQSRKDDLEAWLYMQLEFLDQPVLFWVSERDRKSVAKMKEKLFAGECKNKMDHIPPEIIRIMEYIDGLVYTSNPDYEYIRKMINCAAKTCDVDLDNKFDWEDGKPKFKRYKKKRSWFFDGSDKEKEKKKKKKPRSDKENGRGTGTDTAKQGTSTAKQDDTNDKEKDKSGD